MFQDTRKPLRMWFRAVWHVTSQKNGASAVAVQQVLGLGSYQTAWTWLHKLRRAMVACGLVAAMACAATGSSTAAEMPAAADVSTEGPPALAVYQWLDVDGNPLPFQDHAAIQEALRSATVVSRKKIGRGVAGAEKLVLELGGTRFHAAFRTIDVSVRPPPSGGTTRPTLKYRDAAIFEVAAYELSELLGLGRVPPAVPRRIDERAGTVQIWLEGTRPEVELLEQGALTPPDEARWRRQKQVMRVFDSLIANNDRNQGNLLIDAEWDIWLIDHTRAFKQSSELFEREKLTGCERSLWSALQGLDEAVIRERLGPYLESREIASLLRRREKLLDHLQGLIEKEGEEAVLFDLPFSVAAARPRP